jgi:DNA-binding MarR family transcriptional regulator
MMLTERPLGVIAVFRRTARAMVTELIERLHTHGYPDVVPAFHAVFENIDPHGTRLTELAGRADVTHQSMSELVGVLEDRGYVERRSDPTDGRARLVCLTPLGAKLRKLGNEQIASIERDWQRRWDRAGITADVRVALEAALREAEIEARARVEG